MSDLRVTMVPVGRMDGAEVEAAGLRVSKIINTAVELREPAPMPKASEDTTRGQHRTTPFLAELRAALGRLKVQKALGGTADPTAAAAPSSGLSIFVTDADLFTPTTDAVFGDLDAAHQAAVVSVRRLREAFYRRKADPARQRSRLVKVTLHAIGRIRGLADCRDPRCALSGTLSLADIDIKEERYCVACWKGLSTGRFRI